MPAQPHYVLGEDTLSRLKAPQYFAGYVTEWYAGECNKAHYVPLLDEDVLESSCLLWQHDLTRVALHDLPHDSSKELFTEIARHGEPDHFKHCGHLCFWLRRARPVTKLQNLSQKNSAEIAAQLSAGEAELRRLVRLYANEYLAWHVSFRICQYYAYRMTNDSSLLSMEIDRPFLFDVLYTLRTKSVSPHSIALLFRGIFAGARQRKLK